MVLLIDSAVQTNPGSPDYPPELLERVMPRVKTAFHRQSCCLALGHDSLLSCSFTAPPKPTSCLHRPWTCDPVEMLYPCSLAFQSWAPALTGAADKNAVPPFSQSGAPRGHHTRGCNPHLPPVRSTHQRSRGLNRVTVTWVSRIGAGSTAEGHWDGASPSGFLKL